MRAGRIEQTGAPEEVFEHPANAFVMDFLGNVNVFHGRVHNGRARFGSMELPCPEYPHEEERSAAVYVRPHELEIDRSPNGEGSLPARVQHVNAAGSVAKVQLLVQDSGQDLAVEISRECLAELGLKSVDRVFVFPRRARVFCGEYCI